MLRWKVKEDWKQNGDFVLEKISMLDGVPQTVASRLVVSEGHRRERVDMTPVLAGTWTATEEYLRVGKQRKFVSRFIQNMSTTYCTVGLERPGGIEPYEAVIAPEKGVSFVSRRQAGFFRALDISYGADGSFSFIRVVPEYLLGRPVNKVAVPETVEVGLELILKRLADADTSGLSLGSGVRLDIAEIYVRNELNGLFNARIQSAQAAEDLPPAPPGQQVRSELERLLTEATSSNLNAAYSRRGSSPSTEALLNEAFGNALKDVVLALYEDDKIPQYVLRISPVLYPVGNVVVETPRLDRAEYFAASGLNPGLVKDLGMIVLTDFSFEGITYRVDRAEGRGSRNGYGHRLTVSLSDGIMEGNVQFPSSLPSDAVASLMHAEPVVWVKSFLAMYNRFDVSTATQTLNLV